jgi:uncharacterized repeat protein (TIGR01451 family)
MLDWSFQMSGAAGRLGRTIVNAILALVALSVFSSQAMAVTYSNTTSGALDGNCLTRTFAVTETDPIGDVNLGLLLDHGRRGQIQATLTNPAGTSRSVITGIGGNLNDVNVLFDDEAAASISTHTALNDDAAVAPYQRTFRPLGSFTGFDGVAANGNWVLQVCDTPNDGRSLTFLRADLVITLAPSSYADLSLTKSVSNATPAFADTITYTLTLNNASGSPSTANGITVQDTLPAGVSYVSSSGTGSYSSGTGVWTVGSLAPGAMATLNIVVTVSATTGTVTNNAQVTASSVVDIDSTPNNGITTEDDYASRAFTVSARLAGTPPTLTCPIGLTIFDWDSRTWAAGSLSNNYALTNVGTFGINISTTTAFVAGSPALNSSLTGGLSPVQNSLFLNMNNTSRSDNSTTEIALPTAVPGLQFRLHDVDFSAAATGFTDKVTVTGSFNGNTVLPTLTNGVSNYVVGNVAIGDAGAADASAVGNVVVTFLNPVDTITIVYGNHTNAPADPGNQWMSIHDISFCNPQASLSVTKVSSVVTDLISATNSKAIPGATVRYCITIANAGSATTTNVTATDNVPGDVTYVPGSMTSGATCDTATTPEDDDASDAGETDPFRMSISGTTITGTAVTLAPNASFAMVFNAIID